MTLLMTTPYLADLETHVTPGIETACPGIMDLLASDLALSVFVPTEWTGIKLEPYTLEVKPNIPAFLKARARPIREALYRDAKAEFDRMRTYFYAPSTSTIASPLVVAPKATAPNSELGGLSPAELKFDTTDYHRFNLPLPLVPGNNYCDLAQEL